MTLGLLELLAAALIGVALLIWWMWPKPGRGDLTAPPPNMQSDMPLPDQDERPQLSQPVTSRLSADDLSPAARLGVVRDESDYSEEDLMIRDVRAALHRGSISEAVRRVRRSKDLTEVEALAFIETLDLPRGHNRS